MARYNRSEVGRCVGFLSSDETKIVKIPNGHPRSYVIELSLIHI